MKTSGHLIFYVSENEDFELWRVLSQISPDDRAAFIKNALKRAIAQDNTARNSNSYSGKQNNVFRMDKSGGDSPVADLALEELAYHTMAASEDKIKPFSNQVRPTEGNSPGLINLNELELFPDSEISGKSTLPGLDFLLNNVIGEEDDEKVIEFIRKSKS